MAREAAALSETLSVFAAWIRLTPQKRARTLRREAKGDEETLALQFPKSRDVVVLEVAYARKALKRSRSK
jgi:hypothetical protein